MTDSRYHSIRELGLTITGGHDLAPLLFSDLSDNEIMAVMRRLAHGEPPGVDLEAHRISEEEWARRRVAEGRSLRPFGQRDEVRRRRRKAKKRRAGRR